MRGASPRVLKRLAEALSCQVSDLMPPEEGEVETAEEAGAA